jgi:UDP-GlcNAc:undecaprenyl-phosphate GlcNAc-1-phosphate transferase
VPSLTAYAAVFAVAALTTFALTPVVRRLAIRFGAVVKPDERRVHEVPTPTLGGGAMLIGFLVGMLVAWRLDAFSPAFEGTTEPVGIVLAAVLIFLVGMIDDLREVSAPAKTAGTVLAASVLVLAGVSILQFKIPFDGLIFLSPDISYLVSVIWVFLMVNAINLIDGLDGLAAVREEVHTLCSKFAPYPV